MTARTRRLPGMFAAVMVSATMIAACGGSSDTTDSTSGGGPDTSGKPAAADLDVCALLSDAELTTLVGKALPPEPLGPDSPNIGCSWNTGSLIVQVDMGTTTPVTAPGQECSTVDLGDTALECSGAVQFITHGNRIRVSSDGFLIGGKPVDVVAVATALEPKFETFP